MTGTSPTFEPAHFSGWDSVPPDARDLLMSAGLPQVFMRGRYSTNSEPELVPGPSGRPLVRFGRSMQAGGIFLDWNGAVLELIDHPSAVPRLVNRSLGQFVETLRTMFDQFPYYAIDGDLDQRTAIARRLANEIGRIDPDALDPDGFWQTFLDDVVSGDFATENL